MKLQKHKQKINGQDIVFHGSLKGDMQKITPNKCKHENAYVYASENIPLCIIFGVKRNGENIEFGVGKNGVVYINELYDGAFEDRFGGRACYLYKLPKNQFSLETEYIELVSKNAVDVIDCEYIPDAAKYLEQCQKSGWLKIGRYKEYSNKQKKEALENLKQALRRYVGFRPVSEQQYAELNDNDKLKYDIKKQRTEFCYSKFPDIMAELEQQNEDVLNL